MKGLRFVKMEGSGNDFVVIEKMPESSRRIGAFARKICDRRFGVGADGLLVLDVSRNADLRMRIFNADGSEAKMCGNGARCAALYASDRFVRLSRRTGIFTIETKAGMLQAQTCAKSAKIRLTDPVDLKLGQSLEIDGKAHEVDYVNTGVPHAVMEVKDLSSVPVKVLGRAVRQHKAFFPEGANVNFFKVVRAGSIKVRTYERGVEDETLACGTGSVASALIAALNHRWHKDPSKGGACGRASLVSVETRGGETLNIYFRFQKKRITDVWLEGRAREVFEGEYYF